jgi:hypothetical protein
MKKKTTIEMMDCVPLRKFEWETDEETNHIIIIRPKFLMPFWQNFFTPILKGKHFKIKLDELGSESWLAMDGENSIEQIGKILAKKYGDSIEPIYERLIKFVLQLHREKFIDILCPEEKE